MKFKNKTADFIAIEQKITNILSNEGYKIVDIDVLKTGNDYNVTIYIYKKELDIHNLGLLNEKIFTAIDLLPTFKDKFSLELSSPGINRKIKFLEEFSIFKGIEIKVLTVSGDMHIGICDGLENDKLSLIKNEERILIQISEISKSALNG